MWGSVQTDPFVHSDTHLSADTITGDIFAFPSFTAHADILTELSRQEFPTLLPSQLSPSTFAAVPCFDAASFTSANANAFVTKEVDQQTTPD
jgi:hypothetical protein